MKNRIFGRTGWNVSEIGFGAWAIGGGWGAQSDADSVQALHRALDLGCNFIDTAQGYGSGRSERTIGSVLKERKGAHIYVATKIPPKSPGAWPPDPYGSIEERYPEKYLRESVELSLQQLQTDCIDLIQLHTWTRAWNKNPAALETLRKLKQEGKLRAIGISTPEHDQNSLIDLMRGGWLDAVQVIYNIFDQEAQAEFFPVALEHRVGVIVRVALDESSLTGKFTTATTFEKGDFRNRYFQGDRLERTVRRIEKIKETIGGEEPSLIAAALKFALKPQAVSTVIPGIRNISQAEANCGISDQPPLSDSLEKKLHEHAWIRAFWYGGK